MDRERTKILTTQINKARQSVPSSSRADAAEVTWAIWHLFYGDQFTVAEDGMMTMHGSVPLRILPSRDAVARRMKAMDAPRKPKDDPKAAQPWHAHVP